MKTLRRRIQDARRAGGVNQLAIERDYAQSYVLRGLADTEDVSDTLVFKGGTALKKVHFGRYRFSEDLDFSMVDGPKVGALEAVIQIAIARAQQVAEEIAPVTFAVERYQERDPHPGGQEAFIVRAQYPWQRQPLVPVKIEVTHDEPVFLPAPRCPVRHGYEESFDVTIRTYCLEEIAAEKLRSTQQTRAKLAERGWSRSRARDYYDLWHLVRKSTERIDWEQVSSILPKKCAVREVTVKSVDDIFEDRLIENVRGAWERTLGPFVSDLPGVDTVLTELREELTALLRF